MTKFINAYGENGEHVSGYVHIRPYDGTEESGDWTTTMVTIESGNISMDEAIDMLYQQMENQLDLEMNSGDYL